MVTQLQQREQVTIPKEIIARLGLSEGDKLEVFEKDGFICMMPLAVYPKEYLDELQEEVEQVKGGIRSGKQSVFKSVEALFDALESK